VAAGAGQRGDGPLAVAMPPTPPSSAAMRSSKTAFVGLLMRL
jgi:hypothetical protein